MGGCLWILAVPVPRVQEYLLPGLYCSRLPGSGRWEKYWFWSPMGDRNKAPGERTREPGVYTGRQNPEEHPPVGVGTQ